MSIKNEIAAWDGKSANDIGDMYNRRAHEAAFTSEIITSMEQVSLQKEVSWLLKNSLKPYS